MGKQLRLDHLPEARRKYPAKRSRSREYTIKIRCTKAFKAILEKESRTNRSVHRKYWSESDILHVALADYIMKSSLNWHLYTPTEQQMIMDKLEISL